MRKFWGPMVVAAVLIGACGGGSSESDGESATGGSSASFCDLASEREVAEDAFNDVNIFNPDELEQAFQENRDILERAIAVAPDEVKSDLETIKEDFDAVFAAFEEADWNAAQLGEQPPEGPDTEAAGERVDQYVLEECGIDPESNDTDDPSDEEIAEMLDDSETGDDVVQNALMGFGFPEDQASCLAESISAAEFEAMSGGNFSPEILDRFEACGVGPESLAELGGGIPAPVTENLQEQIEELPPEAKQIFVDELVNQGLSEEEASCIADSMFSNSETVGDIVGALQACDIPLSRMAELGG